MSGEGETFRPAPFPGGDGDSCQSTRTGKVARVLIKNSEYIIAELMPAVRGAACTLAKAHDAAHEFDDMVAVGYAALVELAPLIQYPERNGIRKPASYACVAVKNRMRKYLDSLPAECPKNGLAMDDLRDRERPLDAPGRHCRLSGAEIESRTNELLEEVLACCTGPVDREIVRRRV